MVHELNDKADADNLLKNADGKLIVIDFFAVWCGPCEDIKPFFVELSTKHTNIVFAKVDVDNEKMESVIAEYQVNCMPTFVFIKNGKVVHRQEGANRDELVANLNKYA